MKNLKALFFSVLLSPLLISCDGEPIENTEVNYYIGDPIAVEVRCEAQEVRISALDVALPFVFMTPQEILDIVTQYSTKQGNLWAESHGSMAKGIADAAINQVCESL